MGALRVTAFYFFVEKTYWNKLIKNNWKSAAFFSLDSYDTEQVSFLCIGKSSFFFLSLDQLLRFYPLHFHCCEVSPEMPLIRRLLLVSLPPGSHSVHHNHCLLGVDKPTFMKFLWPITSLLRGGSVDVPPAG